MRAHRPLAFLGAILTVVLIVLGATVRATNSGLSCPDWPTCYGTWLPLPDDIPPDAGYAYYQVMLEWVHRLIAGVILGPLVLITAILTWRARIEDRRLGPLALLLVGLLLVQALLGGVTVLDRNSPWSVAVHLVAASLVLTVLLGIALHRTPAEAAAGPRRLLGLTLATWVTAVIAMAAAALVAKQGASLACPDWPLCDGRLIPDLGDPLVHVQFMHRAWALVTVLLAAVLAWRAVTTAHPARRLALGALTNGLVALLFAGWAIYAAWPVWAMVVHQALAILYFAHVTAVGWMIWWGHRRPLLGEAASA